MTKNRFTVGEKVIIAIFASEKPSDCRLEIAEIESDGAIEHLPGPSHYVIKDHGVFTDAQVFGNNLDAVTWLREQIDNRTGELMRKATQMAMRATVIGDLWTQCYNAHNGLVMPKH